MMRTFLALLDSTLLALTLTGCVSLASAQDPPTKPANGPKESKRPAHLAEDFETARLAIIEAHNKVRAEAKLPSLSTNSKLQAAANAHALDMAIHKKMTHTGSNGSSSIDRIEATGYDYRRTGENVAYGRFSTELLMKGWLDSPFHKRNIVGGFSQIGVGCAIAEDGKRYWCVTFGLPSRR